MRSHSNMTTAGEEIVESTSPACADHTSVKRDLLKRQKRPTVCGLLRARRGIEPLVQIRHCLAVIPEALAPLIYINTYVYIRIYIHTCIHAYINTYICMYVYIYKYIHTCILIHTYMHTYIHTYIHTHIHTYIPSRRTRG